MKQRPSEEGRRSQLPKGPNPSPIVVADSDAHLELRSNDQFTRRYDRDREIATGHRWWISKDPEIAAEQLANQLGGVRHAQVWAAELAEALRRKRS